ncbi:MAG TPA: hypothetical protein VNN72_16645 [Polyangiaceae bacterium]|nr:hypothetical protein [Polyangiaceae bacterium]
MIDENAFGLLIAYLSLEDDEYGSEREDFVARYATFTELVRGRLRDAPPATTARALELGHGLYVEVVEGEHVGDLIVWLRETRALLNEQGFSTAGVLTFGSSWLHVDETTSAVIELGAVKLSRASGPSEPFRRALSADTAARGDEDGGTAGWGPGLYLDVTAVETLGRKPKNAPTILRSGGAEFFRAGS